MRNKSFRGHWTHFKLPLILFLLFCSLIRLPAQIWTHSFGMTKVTSTAVDARGVKWIGTDYGVWSYDGIRYKHYHQANSGLIHNDVFDIAIDRQGNKWIVADWGISKFDGTTWTNYYRGTAFPNLIPSTIAIDSQNNKWVGHGNLSRFNDTTWTTYDQSNSSIPGIVLTISVDAQGTKWFGTSDGISKFDGTTWTNYQTGQNINFRSSAIDRQGVKWFGTQIHGLWRFDGTTWTTYNRNHSPVLNSEITDIVVDAQNNKWISSGQYSAGLCKFDNTSWTNIATYPILSLSLDTTGDLILGNYANALQFNPRTNVFTPYQFYDIPMATSFSHNSLLIEKSGRKWIAGYDGLCKFNGSTWSCFDTVRNIGTCIAIDSRGNKWIGANFTGLYKFNDTTWTRYDINNGWGSNYVRCIAIDTQDNVWIGDGLCIAKFNGRTWTNHCPPFLSRVLGLLVARNGHIWAVSESHLQKFDGTNWTTIYDAHGSDNERGLIEDRQGNIFFAGRDGTFIYNGTVVKAIPGMGKAIAMAVDSADNKWFSVEGEGVYRYDGNNLFLYNTTNSHLLMGTIPGITGIATDSLNNKWFVSSSGHLSILDDRCTKSVELSLELAKGDSTKPMRYSTALNPTMVFAAVADSMRRVGTFDTNGKFRIGQPTSHQYAISRKSLAVEGAPELDGSDLFELELVLNDHPNSTRSIPQLLAMDVNGDHYITEADRTALIERILNPNTGFSQRFSPDSAAWRHYQKRELKSMKLSTLYPYGDSNGLSRHNTPRPRNEGNLYGRYRTGCDTVQMPFVGILLGDADGSYFDTGSDAKKPLRDTLLVLDGLHATPLGGDLFKVPVYATQRAYGFGITLKNYDNKMQIISVSEAASVRSFGKTDPVNKKSITIGYSTLAGGIAPYMPLCYVTVKTKCPYPNLFGSIDGRLNGKQGFASATWDICSSTDEAHTEAALKLYPNPAGERLTIEYSPFVRQLSVLNLLGQTLKVLEINASGRLEADISTLPKGIYFVQANGYPMVKFMKM